MEEKGRETETQKENGQGEKHKENMRSEEQRESGVERKGGRWRLVEWILSFKCLKQNKQQKLLWFVLGRMLGSNEIKHLPLAFYFLFKRLTASPSSLVAEMVALSPCNSVILAAVFRN